MSTRLQWIVLLLLFSVMGSNVSAGVVTVSQQIGTDTTPPTIPTLVTATTISSSQINLVWTASVDDVSLSGYQIFRDSVQIATTSATSYADTGLMASTTYTYTVKAYDWLGNVSTSSATTTATTLQTTTVSNVSGAGLVQVRLQDLQVTPGQQNVTFNWSTNTYTRYILRWGTTQEYLQGSINSDILKRNHQTFIDNLSPETTYFYELVAVNQQGFATVVAQDTFTTTNLPDVVAPVNVANLQALRTDFSVYLSWATPPDVDFKEVRIVRSYRSYPTDDVDGFIVYQGAAESFLDTDALASQPVQYYTVFAYDTSGNVSSGSVVAVRLPIDEVGVTEENDSILEEVQSPAGTNQSSNADSIVFSDVVIQQNQKIVRIADGEAVIERDIPITLTIPAILLSQQPKVITVAIDDGKRIQTYLLRKDEQNQWYQATIPALHEEKAYGILFEVYTYDTKTTNTFTGILRIDSGDFVELSNQSVSSIWNYPLMIPHVFLILLFIVLLMLFYVVWRLIQKI